VSVWPSETVTVAVTVTTEGEAEAAVAVVESDVEDAVLLVELPMALALNWSNLSPGLTAKTIPN